MARFKRLAAGFMVMVFAMGLVICNASVSSAANDDLKSKLAYINVDKVFEEYTKGQDMGKKFEAKTTEVENKRKGMVEDIRKLKEGLEMLSEEARAKKQEEIDNKISELQSYVNSMSVELSRERDEMLKVLVEDIDKVVSEYAKKKGYLLVFHSRFLIFGDESIDITEEVIKILNKK